MMLIYIMGRNIPIPFVVRETREMSMGFRTFLGDILGGIQAKRTLFTFKDVMVRDVLYRTIIESTRKSLNIAMINYLEEKYKDNIRSAADKLLYYAEQAKDTDAIAKYTNLAAESECNA